MSIPQHSSEEDRWYTPTEIVQAARNVLGPIDLDPASDAFGNARVEAAVYHDENTNGLLRSWQSGSPVSVFMNPPGGRVDLAGRRIPAEDRKTKGNPLPLLFWAKLMALRNAGALKHAIVIAFTLEQLSRTQGHGIPSMLDFPFCVPAKRLRYVAPDGKPGKSPPHASAIVYVPGTRKEIDNFAQSFEPFGAIANYPA